MSTLQPTPSAGENSYSLSLGSDGGPEAFVRSAKVKTPSSKPETQRALLIASLAEGRSYIRNDLRCYETETMVEACRNMGAIFEFDDDGVAVTGVGGRPNFEVPLVQAHGSGLVFRTFSALAATMSPDLALTGDETLRRRVMAPLFEALRQCGATILSLGSEGCAPVVVPSKQLKGRRVVLPGNISSQFITAMMVAAPYADGPMDIAIVGEILSPSYIRQTVTAMRHAGIRVEHDPGLRRVSIYPGRYRAVDSTIGGDYTSASYLIAASALFKGTYVLDNLSSESLQGERAMVSIAEAIGLKLTFDEEKPSVTIVNPGEGVLEGDFHFRAEDCPNIIPTLAALGSLVKGEFKVTGGSITRLHKSPRIEAMIHELTKLGIHIEPIRKGDVLDGFVIRGDGADPEGGVELDSWGDHRIFMSLDIVSKRCVQPNTLSGAESVICSFPDYREMIDRIVV